MAYLDANTRSDQEVRRARHSLKKMAERGSAARVMSEERVSFR